MIRSVRDFFRVLFSPCREQTRLLSQALDTPLTAGARLGSRVHTAVCGGCARFKRQLQQIREMMCAAREALDDGAPLPADARARILQQIDENLKER